MKICPKCGESQDLSCFHKSKAKKDGLASYCKRCAIKEAKASSKRNSKVVQERARQYCILLRAAITLFKESLGCKYCNESDACCLDFHHLDRDEKEKSIALLVLQHSKTKIVTEVNKCVCVCSNCHRKIHAKKVTVSPQDVTCLSDIEFDSFLDMARLRPDLLRTRNEIENNKMLS